MEPALCSLKPSPKNERADTGVEGEGGTNWESWIDIYILQCIKELASGKLLCSSGCSAQCSLMSGMGDVGGRRKRESIYVYS